MVKRYGGLWASLTSFENLHAAAYEVLRGKRARAAAGDLFRDLEGALLELRRELLERRYRPGPYTSFWIRDPKLRLISAAPLRDRIVHHALVRVIEPVFERRFVFHSYACRRGKGTHQALAAFVAGARSHRYVLKLDVQKFFPSIDHDVLRGRLARTLKDAEVLWLAGVIIAGSNPQEPVPRWFPGDDLLAPLQRRAGIPIGNLTSQFFGNVMLDDLDHFVKDELGERAYIRYVDDLAIFHDDKVHLRALRAQIRDRLLGLRLHLNERKSRIRRVKEGITFLGFVIGTDTARLAQTAVRRQRRRVRELQAAYAAGRMGLAEVEASMRAWNAHVAAGTTAGLRLDVMRGAVLRRSFD